MFVNPAERLGVLVVGIFLWAVARVLLGALLTTWILGDLFPESTFAVSPFVGWLWAVGVLALWVAKVEVGLSEKGG